VNSILIGAWLAATAAAFGVFLVQARSYRRAAVQPITLGSALWLGSGQIVILFGALMVSFGAPDIAEEFGIPAWWVVAINHATNLGACAGLFLAAQRGSIPRRMPMLLAIAGVAIAVPALVHGAWMPITVLALEVFGGFAAYAVFSAHTRVLADVDDKHRGAAMGLILSFCLLVGVALVGVPLLGGWRVGLAVIAGVQLLLAVAYTRWKDAPQWTPPQWASPRTLVQLVRRHGSLNGGVAANFSGWVALYTIPSLAGVSSDIVVIMAVVAQLIAAALTLWAGRRADLNRRRVGIEAAFALFIGLVGVAVALTWPALAVPFAGSTLGVWLAVVFFTIGEYGGNVNQGTMEAELSLAGGDGVREQLAGLALRFLTVGLANIVLAVLSGVLATAVSGSTFGVVLGVVCAVTVLVALARPLSKLHKQ
jgi:MFS family permease